MIFRGGFSFYLQTKKALGTILFLFLFALPALGEEPQVYTDQDLEKYKNLPAYAEETISQREAELKQWEKEKQNEERLLRDEEKRPGRDEKQKVTAELTKPSREETTKSVRAGTDKSRKKKT